MSFCIIYKPVKLILEIYYVELSILFQWFAIKRRILFEDYV
jgi:hypothetical protein